MPPPPSPVHGLSRTVPGCFGRENVTECGCKHAYHILLVMGESHEPPPPPPFQHTHTHTHTHGHTVTCTQRVAHTHGHTQTRSHKHGHTRSRSRSRSRTLTHTHTHGHTHTHTHTHVFTVPLGCLLLPPPPPLGCRLSGPRRSLEIQPRRSPLLQGEDTSLLRPLPQGSRGLDEQQQSPSRTFPLASAELPKGLLLYLLQYLELRKAA